MEKCVETKEKQISPEKLDIQDIQLINVPLQKPTEQKKDHRKASQVFPPK